MEIGCMVLVYDSQNVTRPAGRPLILEIVRYLNRALMIFWVFHRLIGGEGVLVRPHF